MLYAIGVVAFALGLLASIALHEVGHMAPAKKFGVKVTQYMVGFGPTLWSRKKGDTEYGVKAIPLGGYIRMVGMIPPAAEGKRSRWPRRLATSVEDFRAMNRATVQPGDEDRQFYRLTPGKKMIVMLGGPCMNLLIFLVLTTALMVFVGRGHTDVATTRVASVEKCVVPQTAVSRHAKPPPCPVATSPAAVAGLRPGDRIVSVNGTAITGWNQLVKLIEPATGKQLRVGVVTPGGQHNTLTVTPVANKRYVNGSSGKVETVGFVGVEAATRSYFTAIPPGRVPRELTDQFGQALSAIGSYPQKVVSLWQTVFDGKPRAENGAVGVVGIGRIGGEIAQTHQLDTEFKIVALISMLANINLLLFLFNLLPLLPLDGGHVAGALVESARRGRARLRAHRAGRPASSVKPIYVDVAQSVPLMYAVVFLLIGITMLTLYADIVHPIELFSG